MIDFCNTILKIISDYKYILRKLLPPTQATIKIRELGIKRWHIKVATPVELYNIALRIRQELQKQLSVINTNKKKTSNSYYNGPEKFLSYLEEILANYRLENNQVVHLGEQASTALIAAIQLITNNNKATNYLQQIKNYGNIVVANGSSEQKKIFYDAINKYQENLRDEFMLAI
jgi:hypothetical protein